MSRIVERQSHRDVNSREGLLTDEIELTTTTTTSPSPLKQTITDCPPILLLIILLTDVLILIGRLTIRLLTETTTTIHQMVVATMTVRGGALHITDITIAETPAALATPALNV